MDNYAVNECLGIFAWLQTIHDKEFVPLLEDVYMQRIIIRKANWKDQAQFMPMRFKSHEFLLLLDKYVSNSWLGIFGVNNIIPLVMMILKLDGIYPLNPLIIFFFMFATYLPTASSSYDLKLTVSNSWFTTFTLANLFLCYNRYAP